MERILYFARGGEDFLKDYEEKALVEYIKKHYSGKKGSKNEERFIQDTLRVVNLIIEKIWYWNNSSGSRALQRRVFPKGVPFSQKESLLMQEQFGIKNIKKIKLFLIEHGILVPQKSVWGTDYSYKKSQKFCKHYEINVEKVF